jgi:transcription antitermination protein NusB
MRKSRQISRELALLGISQLPNNPERLESKNLNDLIIAAIRTLTEEAKEELKEASSEVQRGSDRLLSSEIRAADIQTARAMLYEAIDLAQTAINRLGSALDLPETIQLTNQQDVRSYALQIISNFCANRSEIDAILTKGMVDWQLERLPRVDRDILRIAVAEIQYLGIPEQVSINEAVELAKRYSSDDGHKFINGVLRRVLNVMKTESTPV